MRSGGNNCNYLFISQRINEPNWQIWCSLNIRLRPVWKIGGLSPCLSHCFVGAKQIPTSFSFTANMCIYEAKTNAVWHIWHRKPRTTIIMAPGPLGKRTSSTPSPVDPPELGIIKSRSQQAAAATGAVRNKGNTMNCSKQLQSPPDAITM